MFVHELVAGIDSFSLKKRYVSINQLKLDQTYLNINSDSTGKPNYQFLLDLFGQKDTMKIDSLSASYDFVVNKFDFNDARIRYAYIDSTGPRQIFLNDISVGVSEIKVLNDNIGFRINNFALNDQKEFKLEDFTANIQTTPDSVIITQLHAKTPHSEITEANLYVDKSKIGQERDFKKLKVNLDLKKSVVSLKDVGLLVPALKGMDENIEVSGQASGNLADLKGKNIELSIRKNTRLAFDIRLSGLPDIENTYMHIDLKQSFADLNELSQVKLPDDFPLTQLKMPSQLLRAGVIEYNGNFTGFLSDFVAFGTFRSKWGVLTTDLSFVPSSGEKLKINGKLKTVNFQLGELVQTDLLDRITFNGDVKGLLNQKTHDFSASVAGRIDSLMLNDYQYKNIELVGDIRNKQFNGSLVADDPNLKFRFDGAFDLNVPVPVFDFNMLVEKANLKALKLVSGFKQSAISFTMNAIFYREQYR